MALSVSAKKIQTIRNQRNEIMGSESDNETLYTSWMFNPADTRKRRMQCANILSVRFYH